MIRPMLFSAGALLLAGALANPVQANKETIRLRVKVIDAGGHSVNDLHPEDFVVTEDGAQKSLGIWTKELSLFREATYFLSIDQPRDAPLTTAQFRVYINRPDTHPESCTVLSRKADRSC